MDKTISFDEMKKSEEMVERVEVVAYHEAVVRVSPLAVIAVDEDLIVRSMSAAAEELLEVEAGGFTGRHVKDCALLGQAGLAELVNTIQNGVEHDLTCYLRGEGKNKVAVRLHTRRLLDKDGRVLGAALLLETPNRRSGLERAVNQEKIELIRHMSIGIAHHMRNSLTAVRGFIQIMQDKNSGETAKEIEIGEFSSIALKELDHVNEVISRILLLADSSVLKKEAVNVDNLLENFFLFIRGRAALSGILVMKDVAPGLPSLPVDVVKIINALFAILDNAINAMPSGGRLLLRAYALPVESQLCIEVTDTGVGIPQESIKYIFDPFFTTREEGVGFGLALANKIVHDHGGHIKVNSEEGKGTTVSVFLPF